VALPPKPIVFHGRDSFVDDGVRLLTELDTARLAVLGSGGMGKTTVALALLYDSRIMERFGGRRYFVSCEALVDVNSVVSVLARRLGVFVSGDLLTAILAHLTRTPLTVIVIDNLETVWLVNGGPVAAIEELLGMLAQIPTVSIVITCRGNVLPQFVDWSNADTAALEPFSLEAALETFQDRAGRRLSGQDEEIAKQLLNAVDRMPLAVSLLGQLARRGFSLSELLARWNREHSALLRIHGSSRMYNVEASVEVSINMVNAADQSGEALQLLSLCSTLPDGLRPEVFESLRPRFEYIERARDNLTAYALAELGTDRVLRMLSPVRHFVIKRYPAERKFHDALCSIFLDIAYRIPLSVDEHYKDLVAEITPEVGNLSSLLLTLVDRPTEKVIRSVLRLTWFEHKERPSVTVALALIPHLNDQPMWRGRCLHVIGQVQVELGDYKSAISSLCTAVELFRGIGNSYWTASCLHRAGPPYRLLGDFSRAKAVLEEARDIFRDIGYKKEEGETLMDLAELMQQTQDYAGAVESLLAARQMFDSSDRAFRIALCSEMLGAVYLEQGDLESATTELEDARSVFIGVGSQFHTAQCTRHLGSVRLRQGDLPLAEQLLSEAEAHYKETGLTAGLAASAREFGFLRREQGRQKEAITQYRTALQLYESLQMRREADSCNEWIERLECTTSSVDDAK